MESLYLSVCAIVSRDDLNESAYYFLVCRLRESNPLIILGSYFRKQFHVAFTARHCSSPVRARCENPEGYQFFFREPVALGFRCSFGAPNFDPLHVFFNYFSTATVASVSSILVLISSALFESRSAHVGERKKVVIEIEREHQQLDYIATSSTRDFD